MGELRALLARSCLGALKPDLIILDEFQRFKHLLGSADGEATELSELVADLFNYPEAPGVAALCDSLQDVYPRA